MPSFTLDITEKVEFFGLNRATPEFLEQHGIVFAKKGASRGSFVEVGTDGLAVMYVLELSECLRVVEMPELKKRYAALEGQPASQRTRLLAEIAQKRPQGELGRQVYSDDFPDEHIRYGLAASAYDTAAARGVTHATARWFSQYFVKSAFLGTSDRLEFTDKGLLIDPAAFHTGYQTLKHQLKLLQQADVLRVESLPKQLGFYLKFNRQCLPGISYKLAPRFFDTFLF